MVFFRDGPEEHLYDAQWAKWMGDERYAIRSLKRAAQMVVDDHDETMKKVLSSNGKKKETESIQDG